MIASQSEFEAALEEVAALIEHPPADGTPQDRRLGELLDAIARYQPQEVAKTPEPMAEERAQLSKRIEEFHRRYEAQKPKPLPGTEGEGLGPTYAP